MEFVSDFTSSKLPAGFYWFNEPTKYHLGTGLELVTDKETDFWQNTHYGFKRDNGHCLFTRVIKDFTLLTHIEFEPKTQYDQCGLMIRVDEENWIKTSTEYENDALSRLGSVVTNLGYSDWATQDIASDPHEIWYQISRRGDDFLIEYSLDGSMWNQMRIAHLHLAKEEVEVGLYACSPIGEHFRCRFSMIGIKENSWFQDES